MNQIFDQIAKQPITVKLVVLAVLLAIAGAVEYQVFYVPLNENLKQLQKKSADLNVKLVENKAIADNLPKFQEEVNVLNEQLKQAVSLLPNEADVHDIYRNLSIAAKKTNVGLLSFRPGGINRRGFYSEIQMDLRLEGMYHDLAMFIDQVGKLSRIINIEDIVFSSPKATRGGLIVLNLDCKATTFMFEGGRG
jgi:type IV pilus assembly protein PilO